MARSATQSILQHTRRRAPIRTIFGSLFLLLVGTAAGCVTGSTVPEGLETETPYADLGETPTEIVWFPPTDTPVLPTAITPQPTPERRPGIGALITRDEMTSSEHWQASTSTSAAASLSDRGLTLSVQPGAPQIVSLHRSAIVGDAYIEVTARPSLCKERDAYGLVLRAPNEVAHYRFEVICDGTAAAERISLGAPRVLQPPTASADVPLGAPGEVRLGVWASGPELRFFLNDRYQFTASDGSYLSGGVGVFVDPGGDTPVIVTFSNLAIHALTAEASQGAPTP